MEGQRFDEAVKLFAEQGRRTLLRRVAGGLFAGLFTVFGAKDAGAACKSDGQQCKPDCSDCCSEDCKCKGDKCTCTPSPAKVCICHFPPGNPGNAHVICVGSSAVPTHVSKHGDCRCSENGCCPDGAKPGTKCCKPTGSPCDDKEECCSGCKCGTTCCECPPVCPTTKQCPKDFCGYLKVPKGCPPVKCTCPKGYECKDYMCVPCKCVDKEGDCIKCPECPTVKQCPVDFCGHLEVPKGCPPVTCTCPKGKECKDRKCVPCKCVDKDGNCKECPKDFCGHSVGTNRGCKEACTSKGNGCGGTCEKDICDAACPERAGTEDRECTSPKYCDPDCFICTDKEAKFIC